MKAIIEIIFHTDQTFGEIEISKGLNIEQSKNYQLGQNEREMHL